MSLRYNHAKIKIEIEKFREVAAFFDVFRHFLKKIEKIRPKFIKISENRYEIRKMQTV